MNDTSNNTTMRTDIDKIAPIILGFVAGLIVFGLKSIGLYEELDTKTIMVILIRVLIEEITKFSFGFYFLNRFHSSSRLVFCKIGVGFILFEYIFRLSQLNDTFDNLSNFELGVSLLLSFVILVFVSHPLFGLIFDMTVKSHILESRYLKYGTALVISIGVHLIWNINVIYLEFGIISLIYTITFFLGLRYTLSD